MKGVTLFLVVLILFNSCYTYKPLNPIEEEFIVGQKYEIRIGNQKRQRVQIKQVSDSTLLVVQGKTELEVQKSMITESREMDLSTEKTVLASIAGAAALIGGMALIFFTDDNIGGFDLND